MLKGDMEYKNKTVLVTGATAGIGKEIARQYVKNGANVAIWGTNKERANNTLNELKLCCADGQKVFSYLIDVSQTADVKEGVIKVLNDLGSVDILVNNAGITRDSLLLKMSEQDWDLVLDVNLKSIFNVCSSLIRPMMKARKGKIVNISSVIGIIGNAGQANYAASKAGVIGFTKSLAKEVASRGITVNCIAPGYIQTSMTDSLSDEVKQSVMDKIPLKKIGNTKDIANAVLFLTSELASYITGQVLAVDGGMVI